MATATTAKKTTRKTAKPRTTTARKAADTVEKTVGAAESAVKAGAGAVSEKVGQALGSARERISEISSLNREGLDAFVASGTVWQKGVQAVNAEIGAISRRNLEDSMAAFKSLSTAKSPIELFELQSDLLRTGWDNMIADRNRLSEMVSEYTKDAVEPINTQVKKTVEQISQPFAR